MANDKREEESVNDYDFREFIQKTPCARSSFLNGIIGGVVAGCGRFVLTKHITKSCDLAVISFALITIGNWGICRYMHQKRKLEVEKTVDLVTKYSNTKAREKHKDA